MLVNKCCIYFEDNCARSSYYRSVNDKRSVNQNHEKPYVVPDGKGNRSFNRGIMEGRVKVGEVFMLISNVLNVGLMVIMLQSVLL